MCGENQNPEFLRQNIIQCLKSEGYLIENDHIMPPQYNNKDEIRNMHRSAVECLIESKRKSYENKENYLINYIANGDEVNVKRCSPRMVRVRSKSKESELFNYIAYHWSIPVSSGYGRRLRYLILDDNNEKIMGILGLGDPIYALKSRDNYIGWDKNQRSQRLYNIMEAFVLGAVPPYNKLLCGKMVAMMALSNTTINDFKNQYSNKTSIISGLDKPAELVSITTTSALGHSSMYDRFTVDGIKFWNLIGTTAGTGNCQFPNFIYKDMLDYVKGLDSSTYKKSEWGNGYRNKREVIIKCLKSLNLESGAMEHGIKREIYIGNLCTNSIDYLNGKTNNPTYNDWPEDYLVGLFKKRWMIPRSERDNSYKSYKNSEYILWNPDTQSNE